MRTFATIAALSLLFPLLPTARPARAQTDVSDRFGETVDVVVVGVEAVVTDRDGNRVPGLGPDDFRLLVDRRETEIEYFSEVRDGRAAEEMPGTAVDGPPPDTSPRSATNHLVFIDDFFAIRAHRNLVLKGLLGDLETLPPGDRMAVVAFDGEEIDVLAPWTGSREELRHGLSRALERDAHGLLRTTERLRRGEKGPWVDPTSQSRELDRVFTAVHSTLQAIPRPEGRRILLLLGGGWPTDLYLLDPDEEAPNSTFRDDRLDDREQTSGLADAANLLGYTVYPVDVQGLRNRQVAVEREGTGPGAPRGGDGPGPSGYTGELLRQDTLRLLADETGGRALLGSERTTAFASVVEDTRTYYSMGFTSRLRGDGSHHDIRVEVRRPGLSVRSRRGYRDVSRSTELDLPVESVLRFDAEGGEGAVSDLGVATEDDATLGVTLSEPRRADRGTMEATLQVEIPFDELTLLPTEEGLLTRLEIRVAVRDERGELSEMALIPLNVLRKSPPPPGRMIRWGSDLTLRRERHDLVISVHDVASGKILTRRLTVEP
jgi:VWFA-related protein